MKGDDSSPGQRMALVLVPEDFRLGKCILGWTLKNMPNLVGLQNGSDSGERATLVGGVFSEKEKRRSCFGGATNCGSFKMAPTSPKMPFRKSSTKQGLNCGSSKTVPTPPKKPPCFQGDTTAPAPPKKLSRRSPTIQGLNCGSSKTAPAPPKKPHRFGEATNCGSSKTAPTPSKKPLRRSPTKQDLNCGSSKTVPAPPKKPPRFEGATNYDSSKTTLVPPKKPLRRNPTKQGLNLVIVRVHGRKEVIKEKRRDEYAAMCDKMKVECDVLFIEDDDVLKALREHIELKYITDLVVGVEAELYSEKTKSLNSAKGIRLMQKEAPSSMIWFITCNGHLFGTSRIKHARMLIPDGFALDLQLQMVEINKEECLCKLREVTWKKSDLKKKLTKLKEKPKHGSPKRNAEQIEKKKRYERQWKDADEKEFRLRKQKEEMESEIEFIKGIRTNMPMDIDFYDKHEIDKSMLCFDNTPMGKSGGSASVYKARLRGTDVAIKKLHRESMQEFLRKVALLGRVRHPNLATLMGACKEEFDLVYELLPNGSLQDWLERRNEMPPLTWQVRTKIILDIRTVLIFLHSNKPQPVVHGNLKPSKVLLDYNLACKLEASGISQSNGGKAATKHDVHSFGIIILQLLTGLPQQNVDKAMKEGKLDTVLDDTAGKWPTALVNQLVKCGVEMSRKKRPDLLGDVWKVLESLMNADILTSGQDDDGPPNYFICPLTREVMERPYFAADGYTYEYNAIMRLFLRRSNSSVKSPMTNLDLENFKLIPNLALKSDIKEWREKQQQKKKKKKRQVRSLVCDPHPIQNSQVHPIIIAPEEAESQLDTGLMPPASSSPHTTLVSSTTDAHPGPIIMPPNASDDAANHSTAAPPPQPLSPSSIFLSVPTGIRRRHVNNGRPPSSTTEAADVAGPGESSRIPGKYIKQD